MADNKNMELNDEMMANAAGGFGDMEDPKYKVGDTVKLKGKADGFEVLILESLEEKKDD